MEVWPPEIKCGLEYKPRCPTYKLNENVSFHAIGENDFGRRRISQNKTYHLQSRQYILQIVRVNVINWRIVL